MDRPTIAKEAAKRLVGAELQLQNLQTEVTKYIDQDDDAVESYYRAFLDVIYSFQQHIKQQEPHYDTCLAKLNSFDRQYIESMWNKRTDPAHGNSQIKIKLLEKSIRAELVPGVTVFGPLLPL
ncbi:MAG TPA: hypothetical protein VNS63_23455, partial [Blastocatellia bacterium]|nr:hypothetical protein [Blastocatellia bacterium]